MFQCEKWTGKVQSKPKVEMNKSEGDSRNSIDTIEQEKLIFLINKMNKPLTGLINKINREPIYQY